MYVAQPGALAGYGSRIPLGARPSRLIPANGNIFRACARIFAVRQGRIGRRVFATVSEVYAHCFIVVADGIGNGFHVKILSVVVGDDEQEFFQLAGRFYPIDAHDVAI